MTGRSDGGAMLDGLERANLFLIPLDYRRRWYRYHHLFADVLQAHLTAERPDESTALHRRASDWLADAGEPVAAVRHALAGGGVDRAADIAEAALPEVRRERREAIIRAWVDQFPDDVVRRRPVLAIGLVGGLMQGNEFDVAESRLRDVERWLPAIRAIMRAGPDSGGVPVGADDPLPAEDAEGPDPDAMVFLSRAELARVPATVEMYRATVALVHGDLPLTLTRAERSAEAAMPDDDLVRGAVAALSGLARWAMGDLDAAHAGYRTSIEHLRRAGHLADVLGCTIALADLRIAQGRLADAQLAAGIAYLVTFAASIPALPLLAPVLNDPSFVVTGSADTWVAVGCLLDVVNAIACIATAVAVFPVVRRQNESLALGFVTSRVMEAAVIMIGVVSLLGVVTLRQDVAGTPGSEPPALQTTGQALVAIRDRTFNFGPNVCASINALLFGTLLYKSRLVPRIIPTLGLVGAPFLLAASVLAVLGIAEINSAWFLGVVPVAAWELSVGVYMAVKGFRPSPLTATAP